MIVQVGKASDQKGEALLAELVQAVCFGQPLVAEAEPVAAGDVPGDFHQLLVHRDHMTKRLREFHGRPVFLEVLHWRQAEGEYGRAIRLRLEGLPVVEFGMVRIRLGGLAEEVRAAIEARQRPLGAILIEHDVLRSIEPLAYFRFKAGGFVSSTLERNEVSYGRVGRILCDGRPVIDVLEIVAARPARGASI